MPSRVAPRHSIGPTVASIRTSADGAFTSARRCASSRAVPLGASIFFDDATSTISQYERYRAASHANRWSNAALERDYPPLWSRLDRMLFLQGPGFDIVPQWRWQQEQTLQAQHPDRQAMSQARVERFVQFFERVSRQAMRTLPAVADRTIRLDAQRRPRPAA